jgi:hypothetical protein
MNEHDTIKLNTRGFEEKMARQVLASIDQNGIRQLGILRLDA